MMVPTFFPRAQAAIDRGTRTPFDLVGYTAHFLDDNDPRDAVTQLHSHYNHGGGWNDFQGFKFKDGEEPKLLYPGDPPMLPVAEWKLRDERVILFDHAWVAVVQPDGSFRVARMD